MTDALSGRRIEPPNTTGTVAAELLARSLTGTIKLTQTIIGRYYYINVMTTTSNSNRYLSIADLPRKFRSLHRARILQYCYSYYNSVESAT